MADGKAQQQPLDAKAARHLNEYLATYGYLDPEEDGDLKGMDTFDDRSSEALKKFQAFNGLPETGVLDEEAAYLISQPRCGVSDVFRLTTFSTKWNHRLITYAIQNSPANLTLAQVENAIFDAFEIWSGQIPLEFVRVRPNQAHDIDIRFATGDHGDGFPFDGPGTVLAHAFAPPPNGDFAGDVHFDDDETFNIILPIPAGTFDLIQVAAHEIGHALGLDHSSINTALMRPFYHNPTKRGLDPDDVSRIQSLYGSGYIAQTGTALHETGDSWQFGVASNRDLIAIQQQGTNSTEVHALNAAHGYQRFALQTGTALHKTNSDWSFLVASNRDVVAVNRRGTSATEVHVLSARDNYQRFSLQVSTALHRTDANYDFLIAPNRDIIVVKRRGGSSTEIHVLSASSNYSRFVLQTATGLHRTDANFDFAIAPNRDVAALSKRANGRTEAHILSASSGYRSFALQSRTVLHSTDNTFDFAITPERDLFIVKKQRTGTRSTEVHILDLP